MICSKYHNIFPTVRKFFFLRCTCHLLYDIKSGKCKWSSSTSQEKCKEKSFFLTLHKNMGRLLRKSVGKRIWTIHLPPEISRTIRKNDVCSPKIGSPMSYNFLPTTKCSACKDGKMTYAPPKLDPQCLTIFRLPLNNLYVDGKMMYAPPKLDPPCPTIFRRLLNIVHVKM